MISIRGMVGVFFGHKPMEEFASHRYTIFDGLVNYCAASIFTSLLLVFEFLVFWMVSGFMAKQGAMKVITGTAIYGVGLGIAAVALLVGGIVCTYVWGAVHFLLAKFYAGMPGSLNDFNGSWLSLLGSVTFVQRLLLFIPILAWFLATLLKLGGAMALIMASVGLLPALLVHLFGILLVFRFIKARLAISPARAAIVVLLPLSALLLLALILSVIVMVVVGAKII